ncbi:ATP synthase subunit f [Prionailurus iriomotensis]
MASPVPVKEKKLMDVKLGELPGWILMRDFTPRGIAGAFQRGNKLPGRMFEIIYASGLCMIRISPVEPVSSFQELDTHITPRGPVWSPASWCYYRYYNKYVNVKKGSVAGISMVLAAYVVFNYCRCYKELKHERLRKYH